MVDQSFETLDENENEMYGNYWRITKPLVKLLLKVIAADIRPNATYIGR